MILKLHVSLIKFLKSVASKKQREQNLIINYLVPLAHEAYTKGLFGTASPASASSTVAHCSGTVARSR